MNGSFSLVIVVMGVNLRSLTDMIWSMWL